MSGRARTTALAASACFVLTSCAGPAHAIAPARGHGAGSTTSTLACAGHGLATEPGTEVATSVSLGGATATLTGVSGRPFLGVPRLRQPRLTLRTPGRAPWTVAPRPVSGTPGAGVLVAGVRHGGHAYDLCLARFAGSSRPVAVLALTSAFNQCCTIVGTYGPGIRPANRLQDGAWATSLRPVAGAPVLVTGDGRFLAKFADYADSGAPLRVLTVRGGRQVDVTSAHPGLLRADARRWMALFDQHAFGLGFLACWAADQERLGHDGRVRTTLADLAAHHRLTVPAGLGDLWPHGRAYVTALRDFLLQTGYLPA